MSQSDMVQSVLKALDILNCIANAQNGARLDDISEALGIKRTTAHNLIRSLRARGFVEKAKGGRFLPGSAVYEMALKNGRKRILRAAAQELIALSRKYPEAILTFTELTPTEIHCRLRISPDRPGVLQEPFLQIFVPYLTATSRCLQATAACADTFEAHYPFRESGGRGTAEEYCAEKRKIRRERCCMEALPSGSFNIAVAAPDNFVFGMHLDKVAPERLDEIKESLFAAADAIQE